MNRNILLTIEYDGTEFCGWQRQPDLRSAQGEVEKAISIVCGTDIKIIGASRTDAGVHAYAQRANFIGDFAIPAERLVIAANNILQGGKNATSAAGDIRILAAQEVPLDFHARFDAKGKKYIYKISNEEDVDLFRRNFVYQIKKTLDIEAMQEALPFIIGTHDFKCFQASGGPDRKTTVRTVHDLKIIKNKDIQIEITGNAFLYNMVRIITGTLVEVGLGKKHPMALHSIIESRERQNAGHTAPPQGLYLAEVYYDML